MNLKATLRHLYLGHDPASERFRYGLMTFDIVTICFFIVSSMLPEARWILLLDAAIGVVLLFDFWARFVVATKKSRYFLNLVTLADGVVILTLFAAAFVENLAFLRVLRALRLIRSYHVLRDLRDRFRFFKRNEEIIQSIINLVVFVFVITALVYVFQVNVNPDIRTYVDALYFTVTTLTTTGFGDVTLKGSGGRLLAVIIMVFGVALFLRLLQTIFRPAKVRYECPDCGLKRHDPDAVHCKHCGRTIHIETEGE